MKWFSIKYNVNVERSYNSCFLDPLPVNIAPFDVGDVGVVTLVGVDIEVTASLVADGDAVTGFGFVTF